MPEMKLVSERKSKVIVKIPELIEGKEFRGGKVQIDSSSVTANLLNAIDERNINWDIQRETDEKTGEKVVFLTFTE